MNIPAPADLDLLEAALPAALEGVAALAADAHALVAGHGRTRGAALLTISLMRKCPPGQLATFTALALVLASEAQQALAAARAAEDSPTTPETPASPAPATEDYDARVEFWRARGSVLDALPALDRARADLSRAGREDLSDKVADMYSDLFGMFSELPEAVAPPAAGSDTAVQP